MSDSAERGDQLTACWAFIMFAAALFESNSVRQALAAPSGVERYAYRRIFYMGDANVNLLHASNGDDVPLLHISIRKIQFDNSTKTGIIK